MSPDALAYVADPKIKGLVFFKAAWKRLLQNARKHFDANVDYDSYMQKSRDEFEQKWYNVKPSQQTGLKGYREIGTLGSGSYGNVQLVQNEKTGDFFAAKVFLKDKVVTRGQVRHIYCEKRVLHAINFPNHTALEFSRKDNDYLYLGMTLVTGGELFKYHRSVRRFSEKQAIFYAAQVFLALEYLHSLNLIYRDLKPENICIGANGYIKLTDYGFTKYVSSRTLTLCGTPEYLAPELITMKPYSTSVDWWAFGIFVFELVDGDSPFGLYRQDHLTMYIKICEGKYRMPTKFSSSLKNLVSQLLQTDASKRLGVCREGSRDIKCHNWFHKVVWYDILNQIVAPPYVPSQIELNELIKENKRPQRNSETVQYEDIFKDF